MNDAFFSAQELVRPKKIDLERLAALVGIDRFSKRILDNLESRRGFASGISKEAIEEALIPMRDQLRQFSSAPGAETAVVARLRRGFLRGRKPKNALSGHACLDPSRNTEQAALEP